MAISLLLSVFSLFKLQEKDANKTVFKSLFYVSLVAGTLSSFVFFVPFLVILSFLYLKRESSVFKQYWIGATLAFIATFLIQLVLLSSLGFSFSDLLHKLSQWQSLGSDISIYEFLFRQFYFLDYNFTFINAFFWFWIDLLFDFNQNLF